MGEFGRGGRLQVLEFVTDRALMELDFEKLLNVSLQRVRELFDVDTATVLLVDPSGEYLVARASVGLDEEVFQGVRVPVGSGFAGRVAQLRQPVHIERVDESTVVNPLLWEHGLRALLGVPIVAQGELVGVMHIGSTTPRDFTDEEIELLPLVADRIAMAAHLYRSRAEQTAAAALVESLLPAKLPATDSWEFAARYVAGADTGVGGDWYDVFPLPGERLGVVIGDVVGKGLPAAVVMGRLRSALRAYALEYDDPAEVLGKLDRKASHFEQTTMATVAYAVIDTAADRVQLALAGHLPPIMTLADREGTFVEVPLGPPIGYNLAVTGRHNATVDVPPGALLVFYTDGLVERRDTDIDERMEQLRATVQTAAAEAVCARVMATMVGTRPPTDDIALVAVRRTA
ncbi:PP2C family protein-serine/threonine phosphatase [Actinophytocola oryzae]|uniref:Serine phosphatase RsbU (Regulator of sigma subunit) n=1 Tax=Actinophytocola oryzae TaxID=502181 RepID=A0A4R7V5S9_9PSEU|nr:GAF domain-containing SpoIIE family protein phosphatase [Actinophytocola oryzae]TDV44310.1 serine phosphatase RsbU (regulator of sigma subunit) [Actinophytocola oryzae]